MSNSSLSTSSSVLSCTRDNAGKWASAPALATARAWSPVSLSVTRSPTRSTARLFSAHSLGPLIVRLDTRCHMTIFRHFYRSRKKSSVTRVRALAVYLSGSGDKSLPRDMSPAILSFSWYILCDDRASADFTHAHRSRKSTTGLLVPAIIVHICSVLRAMCLVRSLSRVKTSCGCCSTVSTCVAYSTFREQQMLHRCGSRKHATRLCTLYAMSAS